MTNDNAFSTAGIERWAIFEVVLKGPDTGNPFLDVALSATFTHNHRAVEIEGFYDGDGVYRIRFMPDTVGEWRYITHSTSSALDSRQGGFTCTPATGGNHGPVRVDGKYHFRYEAGTPHFSFGTTCYVWNHQGEALEARTLETLKKKQIAAGNQI